MKQTFGRKIAKARGTILNYKKDIDDLMKENEVMQEGIKQKEKLFESRFRSELQIYKQKFEKEFIQKHKPF